MTPLFVYGTLRPGQCNAHLMEKIGGKWQAGYINGRFYESGWGAATGFPGVVLDPHGPPVEGFLFLSENLADHWPILDAFEDGYDRVLTEVTFGENQTTPAWVYQLQPNAD